MIRASLLAVMAITCAAAPSSAMSGGELFSADKVFGAGFVFGASSALFQFEAPQMGTAFENGRLTCPERAAIGSNAMYDLVMARLRAKPSYLTVPATYVVAEVLGEICSK